MELTKVRFYLEANSKDEMIKKQLENNQARRKWFDYSPPVKEGNKWVCWYFDDVLKRGAIFG